MSHYWLKIGAFRQLILFTFNIHSIGSAIFVNLLKHWLSNTEGYYRYINHVICPYQNERFCI